ncbi:Ribonuclease 3-like protein 3 [Cardamine amara subsp. amara]|uniref:Ribonuclease 3-like protein 3 n=1 Tax=Cardamine amara subsp. amara TaxID=228776 RepID=A0ABD0ZAD4_CARAN
MESVEAVEKILNYSFTNKSLLKEAISNGSIESTPKFQRLEFLGDSVLEVAITNHIHLTAPNIRTRELRKLRHANVRNEIFARAAVRNNLYQYTIRDTHDLQQTEQVKVFSEAVREENGPVLDHGLVKAPKVLAELVESIAGAVYYRCEF